MRVVFLNGPPGCGKDTAGNYIVGALPRAKAFKLAGPLKDATHALYGLGNVATDAFEAVKNDASLEFFGISPRQAYIAVSEKAVKPAFGVEFFGAVLARRMKMWGGDLAVITDSGFADEAKPIVQYWGARNCLLMRMHRDGCTFAGDSRSHLYLAGVRAVDIRNNGTRTALENGVVGTVRAWLCHLET